MSSSSKKVKLAAVQAEPAWNDLQGSVQKVCALIKEAGKNGANVLGFPEVFVPGYPWSIWTESVFKNAQFVHEYMANSLARESKEMDTIRAAVKEAGIFVVLGYSERDGGSLYIAQSFIDPSGTIVLHRRKIKPTHVERSIWGDGQAESLKIVTSTPFGNVGALNCWENMQPLLRYAEYSQKPDIHVAGWPPMFPKNEKIAYHTTGEAQSRLCQVIAMEGACFVIVATQVVRSESAVKTKLNDPEFVTLPSGGFAQIFGPDGNPLCDPIPPGEEGILYKEVDLTDRDFASQMIDTVGHYSRPDLLSLNVTEEAAKHVYMT